MTETTKINTVRRYRATSAGSAEDLFQIEAADFEQAMHRLRRLHEYIKRHHPHQTVRLQRVEDPTAPVTTSIFLEGYFLWLEANAFIF